MRDRLQEVLGLEGTNTDQWRAGPQVTTGKDIKPGTAIATFDSNGHYPKGDQPKHSGIFLKKGTNGSIWILDQWPARSGTGQESAPTPAARATPGQQSGRIEQRKCVSRDYGGAEVMK